MSPLFALRSSVKVVLLVLVLVNVAISVVILRATRCLHPGRHTYPARLL